MNESTPVMHGLGDMHATDNRTAGEIGDAARNFENAMISPCRKSELGHGLLQQRGPLGIRQSVSLYFLDTEPGVRFALALHLQRAGGNHPCADGRRGFTRFARSQFSFADGRDFEQQIDAIEKGTGEFSTIAHHQR